jgi:hypothetical protein
VWAAYHELARARSEAAVRRLIEALGEARVLSPSVTASVVPEEPERFVRVWSVLEPTPLPVMLAMTVGQGLGTASLAIFGLVVLKDLTRTRRERRDSLQSFGLSKEDDS